MRGNRDLPSAVQLPRLLFMHVYMLLKYRVCTLCRCVLFLFFSFSFFLPIVEIPSPVLLPFDVRILTSLYTPHVAVGRYIQGMGVWEVGTNVPNVDICSGDLFGLRIYI